MSLSGISKQENRPQDTSHTVVGMKPGAEHLFTYSSFPELQLTSDNRAFNYMGLIYETFIYLRVLVLRIQSSTSHMLITHFTMVPHHDPM